MKTYKKFNEAAALAIPAAMKVAPYVIPALGGIVKGVSAITNRETGLSDSEKRRVGELMDIINRKKQREKTQQTEKDILDYSRKRKKEGVDEGYKDPTKRELKLKGQQIINDKEKYDKGTTPVRLKKA